VMVGCGKYGSHLMDAILERDDVEMVGIADHAPENLKEVCDKYNCKGFFDFCEMLDELKPDIAFDATHTCTHAFHSIEAAKRGIHMFTEKPIAMSVEEADAMVKACRDNDVVGVGDGGHRFSPLYHRIHDMYEAGDLGCLMGQWSRVLRGFGFNRHHAVLHPERTGGWLLHHMIHLILSQNWFGGPAEQVYAVTATTVPELDSEELVYAITTYKNGSSGMMSDSVGQMRGHGSDLVFSKATIEELSTDTPNKQAVKIHWEGNYGYDRYEVIEQEVPANHRHSGPIGHFFDCIYDRSLKCWSDYQAGRDAIEVANAMKKSAQTKQVVKIG